MREHTLLKTAMTVCWRDDIKIDHETKTMEYLKNRFGAGPFVIASTEKVPEYALYDVAHPQWITLNGSSHRISGYWVKLV